MYDLCLILWLLNKIHQFIQYMKQYMFQIVFHFVQKKNYFSLSI